MALSSADIKLRPPLSLLLIRTGSSKTSLGSPRRNFTRKRLRMSTIWRISSSIEGKSFWNHCLTNVCSRKKIVSKCSMRTANPPQVLSSVCTSGLRIWAILASISSGIGTKTTSSHECLRLNSPPRAPLICRWWLGNGPSALFVSARCTSQSCRVVTRGLPGSSTPGPWS